MSAQWVQVSYREVVKQNAIAMAKEHKEHCKGEACAISLFYLLSLLDMAGILLSEEEKRYFV